MIHGTTDKLRTWCMDEVVAVDGWAMEADSVECIECLRRQIARLEGLIADADVEGLDLDALWAEALRIREAR